MRGGLDGIGLEPVEVRGRAARERLGDDALGRLADALELAQAPGLGTRPELGRVELLDRGERAAERPHTVRGGARLLEQERDALERGDRVHGGRAYRDAPAT